MDPAGDARSDPRIARSPDLVSAAVEVTASDVRINVRFASGSFDRSTTLVAVPLDTDESVQTGVPGLTEAGDDASLIGVDYVLIIPGPGSPILVRCVGRNPFQCVPAGTPVVTFVVDGVDIVVTRGALGNDDGRMTFKVTTTAAVSGVLLEGPDLDVMPDVGVAPARVQ